MGLTGIMLSEVSHTEKDKYHIFSLIYDLLKIKQNRLTDREQTCDCQGGGGTWEEGIGNLGLADANYYV